MNFNHNSLKAECSSGEDVLAILSASSWKSQRCWNVSELFTKWKRQYISLLDSWVALDLVLDIILSLLQIHLENFHGAVLQFARMVLTFPIIISSSWQWVEQLTAWMSCRMHSKVISQKQQHRLFFPSAISPSPRCRQTKPYRGLVCLQHRLLLTLLPNVYLKKKHGDVFMHVYVTVHSNYILQTFLACRGNIVIWLPVNAGWLVNDSSTTPRFKLRNGWWLV